MAWNGISQNKILLIFFVAIVFQRIEYFTVMSALYLFYIEQKSKNENRIQNPQAKEKKMNKNKIPELSWAQLNEIEQVAC